ncbi:MAG TPA: glycoside hydrolase family 27 protein [Edaphobacter sp.]|nr:glycoside hydrolase family 27 protein [Edaphobacter sp.]
MFIRMGKHLCAAAVILFAVAQMGAEDKLAPTPPMGWNSWDSYGLTVNETQFRANMVVMAAQLKEFGWQYVVVDEGWYLENPELASMPEKLRYTVNARGQYEPAVNRFPSAKSGEGFKALSDAVHENGLKFGIHIIRGIPKQTVIGNARIGTTKYRAGLAADTTDKCPWNPDNFGVKANTAGQAWYDALMKQYASWGVDYIKVDCIASHPYKGAEIAMIHKAIGKSGRAMVLSLSPGPTALENAEEVGKNAQLWRISDDVWDYWEKPEGKSWPQSVKDQFPVIASWAKYARPGNWPDADMLPIGQLRPTPGEGKARASRLTPDEQRTMITLWAMARSPLFIGGNLMQMDDALKSMLTNPGVIEVDQQSMGGHMLGRDGDVVAWVAVSKNRDKNYLALFNLGDTPVHVDKTFAEYGFIDKAQYNVRDLWMRKELGPLNAVTEELPPHGSVMLSLHQ